MPHAKGKSRVIHSIHASIMRLAGPYIDSYLDDGEHGSTTAVRRYAFKHGIGGKLKGK
jgi:hypothetical protein